MLLFGIGVSSDGDEHGWKGNVVGGRRWEGGGRREEERGGASSDDMSIATDLEDPN